MLLNNYWPMEGWIDGSIAACIKSIIKPRLMCLHHAVKHIILVACGM